MSQTKHITGHIGDRFLQVKWLNQQCQSTEGSSSPRDELQYHQVHLTVLISYTCMQYSDTQNTKMNLSTVNSAQWDKTQSRELLGLFMCVCIALFTVVAHSIAQNKHTHTHTTILRPFFRDHPGEPVPEENFWTLWCKGRLTEADTSSIRLGATPSGLTSARLHHPPYFLQARCPSCRPTNIVKALKATSALGRRCWSSP